MATAQLTVSGVSIRNVLIATDLSRQSNTAVALGVDFARSYGAKAEVMYVVPHEQFLMAGPEVYIAMKDAARRDLLDFKDQLRRTKSYEEGQDYQLVVAEGDVAECILDCTARRHIDLVVMSTHGRSGLGRALLGSVAERVFRHSAAPVLTLGPRFSMRAALPPRRILVPVDFTSASERSVQYACALAQEHHAKLAFIHVIEPSFATATGDVERLQRVAQDKLRDFVAGNLDDESQVEFYAALGEIVPAILDCADTSGADFMVLGVHAITGLLDRLRWQVAYAVVRGASCPVLTVREQPKKV